MTRSLRSDGFKLGNKPRGEPLHSFLSKEEHGRLCEDQGRLRSEIAEINRQISHTKGSTAHLVEQRDRLVVKWKELNGILEASDNARTAIRTERRARLGANAIAETIKNAKALIERLQEQLGDNWTEEQVTLCGDLRDLTTAQSPLLEMVHRSELEQLRAECERESRLNHAAAQLATNQLKAQIRDLQMQQGKAARVLRRLYEGRYQEVECFRLARGVTHRIHLTGEDCDQIEDAIS